MNKTDTPAKVASTDELGQPPERTEVGGLSALRGIAKDAGPIAKCQWCGGYFRVLCQCPSEVEIERLRKALNIAGSALHRWVVSAYDDDDRAQQHHVRDGGLEAVKFALRPSVANKGIATRAGLAKQTELARGNSP